MTHITGPIYTANDPGSSAAPVVPETRGEVLSANDTLTMQESGKVYYLANASGLTVTLPVIATAGIGARYKFIVKTAPTAAGYVITEATASDTNKICTNGINELEVDTNDDGPYDANHTTITFAANIAVAGDWVELETDGTYWYATGQTKSDGGVTLA